MKKINVGLMLAMLAAFCIALLVAIFLAGCGGGDDDDDTNCAVTDACSAPDGGTMADADPTAPDADTTPDANSDPCAEYAGYAGEQWTCQGGGLPYPCPLEITEYGDTCYVGCGDPCPAPPLQAVMDGFYTCTTIAGYNVNCSRNF